MLTQLVNEKAGQHFLYKGHSKHWNKKKNNNNNILIEILYCSILLHFPLNYNQLSVLRANTCQFFTFTFKTFKNFKVFKSSCTQELIVIKYFDCFAYRNSEILSSFSGYHTFSFCSYSALRNLCS
jgi:hypothetical protein